MELAEVVLAITFSGLLLVLILSVFFFYKSKLQRKKIKKSVADVRLEQLERKEPILEYKSIEEKTSGRYKLVKLKDDKYNGRDNAVYSHPESVPGNNQNVPVIQIKSTSKKFSRLERVI